MIFRLLAMIIPISVSLNIYDNTTFDITRSNMCLVKFVWPIHNETFHMPQNPNSFVIYIFSLWLHSEMWNNGCYIYLHLST